MDSTQDNRPVRLPAAMYNFTLYAKLLSTRDLCFPYVLLLCVIVVSSVLATIFFGEVSSLALYQMGDRDNILDEIRHLLVFTIT